MKYSKYPTEVDNSHMRYFFFSEGPKGRIKKTVLYSQIEEGLFNLAFGVYNGESKKLDDLSRTNNGDRDKILATVAATVLDFTNQFSGAMIYAEGSTPARTRLYQIGIANNLEEIGAYFEIEGYIEGDWEPFQQGWHYDAFLFKRK